MDQFLFRTKDKVDINVLSWKGPFVPKAIIQICHGMAEYIDRYDEFANFLVSNGYYVYGHDHRGHGKTAGEIENLGFFADKNGWKLVVDDVYEINNMIKERHPGKEVVLFGHSMGSFIVRTFMFRYPDAVERFIVCGTGDGENFSVIGAKLLAGVISKVKGKRFRSKVLDGISNKRFNKYIKNSNTGFDWLSRDKNEVDKYIKDPYCGSLFTAGFYHDLFKGVEHLSMEMNIKKINPSIKMLVISGDKDPVGDNGKGVIKVVENYKKRGIKNIDLKLYEDARHEILNETNRKEVFEDVLNFIES